MRRSQFLMIFLIVFFLLSQFVSADVFIRDQKVGREHVFEISNDQIACHIVMIDSVLDQERSTFKVSGSSKAGSLVTDGNFRLDLMWTDWRAPKKFHNADNVISLDRSDFKWTGFEIQTPEAGKKILQFNFKGTNNPIDLKLIYQLGTDAFYFRKSLAVRDTTGQGHFLRWIWPNASQVEGEFAIHKSGGFGNPIVLQGDDQGAFFGLEYPASTNKVIQKPHDIVIQCGQEMGETINSDWAVSHSVVCGLTPKDRIKLWFFRYLDDIRVAPLKPYLLYNTWYDVRSPEYTDRPEDVMNEANLLRIIADFKREMVEKRGLRLNTFVLDDGWDIYKSDWKLREAEFPNGLKPIQEALAEMGTELGIWIGPIGGYSYRKWRIEWMTENGYEAEDDQLCVAGTNYKKLLTDRVTDFVKNDQVGYFKWDGIQFSCSEPDHGHPTGVYSRRAVMESVADLCHTARRENPDVFLNITSGTWLSPWWLQHANQIWMQGYDYGYANVPSISKRDAAITYRDYVLYEDFGLHDFWFPIANLMTHGIIKGHLQKLGGEAEPLDKFTDNAILYFARGVSMYELYISPNLLTDAEWTAISKSIKWAEDRFDILKNTQMIGGNPGDREAYGYTHFDKDRGILALRNPFITKQHIDVILDPSSGLCEKAASLVLERIYPTRWISPNLYAAGAKLTIPLDGFETAIYEIYPLREAVEPLISGLVFDVVEQDDDYVISIIEQDGVVRYLNPETILQPVSIPSQEKSDKVPVAGRMEKKGSRIDLLFNIPENTQSAVLAVLLEPSEKSTAEVTPSIILDKKRVEPVVEKQESGWQWLNVPVNPGQHTAQIQIGSGKWKGRVSAWSIQTVQSKGQIVNLKPVQSFNIKRPMPPRPWPAGQLKKTVSWGSVEMEGK